MAITIKQNYSAFLKSQEVILEFLITEFPLDIYALIEKHKIIITTIAEYELFRKATNETRPYIKIKDGRTIYDPNRDFTIVVIDDQKYKERIRFTLAHELGHIVMKHLDDERTEIDRGGLSDELYRAMEKEADTFAGNLLAPPVIACAEPKTKNLIVSDMCNFFGLSVPAVQYYRIDDCIYWRNTKRTTTEKIILNNYKNRNCPKHCSQCGFQLFGGKFCFCPICGEKLLSERGERFMTFDRIEISKNGKAVVCPICGNDETDIDGGWCQICGKLILNRCTQQIYTLDGERLDEKPCCEAAKVLPGNARYCPYCGSKSTFLTNGLLPEWNINEPETDDDLPY